MNASSGKLVKNAHGSCPNSVDHSSPSYKQNFGKVSYNDGIFYVHILKPLPKQDEFSKFIEECRDLYSKIDRPFLLAFHIYKMHLLGPTEMLSLFMLQNVLPITKKYLILTIVYLNIDMKNCIDLFLKVYTPTKPFKVVHDKSEFHEIISKHKNEIFQTPNCQNIVDAPNKTPHALLFL